MNTERLIKKTDTCKIKQTILRAVQRKSGIFTLKILKWTTLREE